MVKKKQINAGLLEKYETGKPNGGLWQSLSKGNKDKILCIIARNASFTPSTR